MKNILAQSIKSMKVFLFNFGHSLIFDMCFSCLNLLRSGNTRNTETLFVCVHPTPNGLSHIYPVFSFIRPPT